MIRRVRVIVGNGRIVDATGIRELERSEVHVAADARILLIIKDVRVNGGRVRRPPPVFLGLNGSVVEVLEVVEARAAAVAEEAIAARRAAIAAAVIRWRPGDDALDHAVRQVVRDSVA